MRTLFLAVLLLAPASALADYDSEGRRDPFVSAVTLAADSPAWDQVRPTALLSAPDGGHALLVGGPAGQGVLVRPGDALGVATVRSIDATRRVVVLEVPAPLSPRGIRSVVLALAGDD